MRGRIVGLLGAVVVVAGLFLDWAGGAISPVAILCAPELAFASPVTAALFLLVGLPLISATLAVGMWATLAFAPAVGGLAIVALLTLVWIVVKTGVMTVSPGQSPGLLAYGIGTIVLLVAGILGARDRKTEAMKRILDGASGPNSHR